MYMYSTADAFLLQHQGLRLEQFLWTGSGDGEDYSNAIHPTPPVVITTIFHTTTVHTTVFPPSVFTTSSAMLPGNVSELNITSTLTKTMLRSKKFPAKLRDQKRTEIKFVPFEQNISPSSYSQRLLPPFVGVPQSFYFVIRNFSSRWRRQ